jgi:tubby-related protein 1
MFNLYPQYRLYLKNGMTFLLAARKRKKSKTANYVLSLDAEDINKHSTTYIGKVRANFIGTEFTVFDKGLSPDSEEVQSAAPSDGLPRAGAAPPSLRQELVFCTYESNILGAKGPRKMHVILPKVYENDQQEQVRPEVVDENGLRLLQEEPSKRHKTMLLHNKPPKWNEKVAAFVLNFNGRVTMASVKNFQLVLEEDEDENVVLQFGKVGQDEFTMDYAWPMSPIQAFGICLGSLDNKLACE